MIRGTACLLLSLGLATFLGCGGRTEELFDDHAAAGARSASGGSTSAGAANVAGFGASSGASSVGGAPFFEFGGSAGAGASSGFGAAAGFVAAGGSGAAAPAGGASSVGGFTGIAGAPSAGFPGVAGSSGSGPIIDACTAIAASSCGKCLCSACSSQVVSCFSTVGCALIFACIEKTGCRNAGCFANTACGPVIDQYGGVTGSALDSVISLAACSLTSQATCTCN